LIRLNQREYVYELGSQPLIVLTTWGRYLSLHKRFNAVLGTKIRSPVLIHYKGEYLQHRLEAAIISCPPLDCAHFNPGSKEKWFMYKVLQILTKSNSSQHTHLSSIWKGSHLLGAHLDRKELLWCSAALSTFENASLSSNAYVRDIFHQSFRIHVNNIKLMD